jgi:hypothetical protein
MAKKRKAKKTKRKSNSEAWEAVHSYIGCSNSYAR